MATINFLYRSNKDNGNLGLRLLYRHNNKDFVLGAKTNIQVSKEYWKDYHKSNSRDISIKSLKIQILKEMNNIERFILNKFNTTDKSSINKEWLSSLMYEYSNPLEKTGIKPPEDLINFIDLYIERRIDEVESTTITKFKVIKHKMMRLQESRKRIIYIKDINEEFKKEFWDYYKLHIYGQNTASRELDIIKSFCYYAKSLGIETHPQLEKIKIKKINVEKIYLSFDELEKIEKLDDSKLTNSLLNVRDWLVISCYLGQRISDFLNFNKNMIRYELNKEGDLKPLIEFTQKKTKKIMTIPIHPKVVEYLNKRDGNFPERVSDQKYNNYIKEVCKIAEIDNIIYGKKQLNISTDKNRKIIRGVDGKYPKYELITSHVGRRSFASNFYGDIKTNYLKYVTGHSTEVAFLNYIGKSNKDTALELTSYF